MKLCNTVTPVCRRPVPSRITRRLDAPDASKTSNREVRTARSVSSPKKKGCQDWFRRAAALGWPPSRRSERNVFSRGRHDGHEYACCGGRDPARDSGTDVGSRDRGASWSAPTEQVKDS